MANALPAPTAARLQKITQAFKRDGFEEILTFPDLSALGTRLPYCTRNGSLGVAARHNGTTLGKPRPKKAFYVEGDHATMGWLMGFMAEPDICRMTIDYKRDAIIDFIHADVRGSWFERTMSDLFLKITAEWVDHMKADIPTAYHEEIEGMYKGCVDAAAPQQTRVTLKDLWELNVGTDAILAHLYTGELLKPVVDPKFLRLPLHCNFFAAPGSEKRRLFGRDYIFPTAGVFQDTGCMIVHRPANENAFINQTAPGLVGCITGLNSKGVGIGVHMTASALCDPARPGFNSLLLIRHCMEHADTAPQAVDTILDAQRGVAWIYPVADALGNSCAVEAGKRIDQGPIPYFHDVSDFWQRHLPDLAYVQQMQNGTAPDRGAFVRRSDYAYPEKYITDWNRGLWKAYRRNPLRRIQDLFQDLAAIFKLVREGKLKKVGRPLRSMCRRFVQGAPYSPTYFGPRGFISTRWTQRHCPGPFYFAPQRETRPDTLMATNTFISPEMRLTGMAEWISVISHEWYDDFQWRYDELNKELMEALDAHPDGLDDDTAWKLINFLTSKGPWHEFHNPGGKHKPDEVVVRGSVSLCDLTTLTMKSLYGLYGDQPVTISLRSYVD